MKKLSLILLLMAGFLIASCNQEKKNKVLTNGHLQLSTTTPKSGDQLNITYDNPKAEQADVEGKVYNLTADKVFARAIKLKKDGEVWKGQIQVPDSAVALAFDFEVNGHLDDNNGKGYIQPLYDEQGELEGKTFLAISNYYNSLPSFSDLVIEKDSVGHWLKGYFGENMEVASMNLGALPTYLYADDKEGLKSYSEKRIANLTKEEDSSLETQKELARLYTYEGNKAKADSLSKVVESKDFSNDQALYKKYGVRLVQAKTLEDKLAILKEYDDDGGKPGIIRDFMLGNLAATAAKAGDYDTFDQYVSEMSSAERKASQYNNMAYSLLGEKDADLDLAAEFGKKAVENADPAKADEEFEFQTPKEHEKQLKTAQERYKDTYAAVLYKKGDLEGALKLEKEAVGEGENPEINENYIKYLQEDGDYESIEKAAAQYIAEGHAGKRIEEAYSKAYKENHGSEEGLDKELASLKDKAQKKLDEEVSKMMLDKEAPNFTLKDNDGNEVSLADLKGKTVVLDFWATWCGPCIASFPGMEMAVNHFKDDPDVQFYFVNTFQREPDGERQKKVMDFIKKNKYPFEVLYDKNDHNNFETANSFGITGIPTKIIIDKNGKWKFTKVGWYGNSDHLLAEVKTMVKLIE